MKLLNLNITRILENHAYKIKDMKKDAEEELSVNVGYSKHKRARSEDGVGHLF